MMAFPSVPTVPVTVDVGELVLRPVVMSDRAALETAYADPAISMWSPSRETVDVWLQHRSDWSSGEHMSWAVAAAAAPDDLLGSLSLHSISLFQRDAQIGYWLLPVARGQSIASRTLRAATSFAFSVGLQRVSLFHAIENDASCAVARAAGYQTEGTHRSSYRYGDGEWHDEHSHARLAAD